MFPCIYLRSKQTIVMKYYEQTISDYERKLCFDLNGLVFFQLEFHQVYGEN